MAGRPRPRPDQGAGGSGLVPGGQALVPGTHAQHVAQAQLGDADAERGLIAISRITQDDPHRHAIRQSLTELSERDRGLALKRDGRRHASFGPAQRIVRPGLGQKQPVSDRQAGMVVGHREADRHPGLRRGRLVWGCWLSRLVFDAALAVFVILGIGSLSTGWRRSTTASQAATACG